ncbi:MAG: threonine ammonia-lyase [Candidatus Acidiferrales bacterium]
MNFSEVEKARSLLRDYLSPTRLISALSLSQASGASVYLKLESEHPTGSFKVRGALNALACRQKRGRLEGVVTSSTGNHGAGVAYAARQFNLPAAIFLPLNPNPVKRARIAGLGGQIFETGRDLEESRQHAAEFSREHGWPLIVDVDDPDICAGAATMGCEILEQLPETETILIPVGDSNLIRGVAFAAKHLKGSMNIIGIQAAGAPAYFRSWKENRAVVTETADTIADGLATRTTTEANVRGLRELVDDMRLVTDHEMIRGVGSLLLEEHVVAEPSGAAATAALLASGREFEGKCVVLLVTGANVPKEILRKAIFEE